MQQKRNKVQVWDPLIRIFHWMLVACFATAYILEDEFIRLHLLAGSTILGLVAFRIIWGFTGTRHARFTDFTPTLSAVKAQLQDLLHRKGSDHIGHTPVGSIMIFALLTGLLILTISGVVLYGLQEGAGPLAPVVEGVSFKTEGVFKEAHDFMADLLIFLVGLHIAGVLTESLLQRKNLIRSMITGYKYVTQKENNT
jgi:cytochrome b